MTQNCIHEYIKSTLNSGCIFCHSVNNIFLRNSYVKIQAYEKETIVLPVSLEEYEKVTRRRKTLRNEQFQNVSSPPNIVSAIK